MSNPHQDNAFSGTRTSSRGRRIKPTAKMRDEPPISWADTDAEEAREVEAAKQPPAAAAQATTSMDYEAKQEAFMKNVEVFKEAFMREVRKNHGEDYVTTSAFKMKMEEFNAAFMKKREEFQAEDKLNSKEGKEKEAAAAAEKPAAVEEVEVEEPPLKKRKKIKKSGIKDFDKYLDQLRAYRRNHGHCNVPGGMVKIRGQDVSAEAKLGHWCTYIRRQYGVFRREYQTIPWEDMSTALTQENIFQLIDIGFQFVLKTVDDVYTWEQRIEQCREFRAKHGNLKIPVEDRLLGGFCSRVRRMYKDKTAGKKSNLTDEREKELADMGFVFYVRTNTYDKDKNKPWEERLEELKKYVAEHGDAHVPLNYGDGLGEWAKNQRRHYRWMTTHPRRSSMTPERFRKLTELGFTWVARGKVSKSKEVEVLQSDDDDDGNDGGRNDEDDSNYNNPSHPQNQYQYPPAHVRAALAAARLYR